MCVRGLNDAGAASSRSVGNARPPAPENASAVCSSNQGPSSSVSPAPGSEAPPRRRNERHSPRVRSPIPCREERRRRPAASSTRHTPHGAVARCADRAVPHLRTAQSGSIAFNCLWHARARRRFGLVGGECRPRRGRSAHDRRARAAEGGGGVDRGVGARHRTRRQRIGDCDATPPAAQRSGEGTGMSSAGCVRQSPRGLVASVRAGGERMRRRHGDSPRRHFSSFSDGGN